MYRKLARVLDPSRILTEADQEGLAVLASALAQYAEAERSIAETGTVILSTQGVPVQSPYLAVQRASWDRIKALLPEFGLTPSARARMGLVEEPVDDGADDGFTF